MDPDPQGEHAAVHVKEPAADEARLAALVHVVPEQEDVRHGRVLGGAPDLRRHAPGPLVAGAGIADQDEPRRVHRVRGTRARHQDGRQERRGAEREEGPALPHGLG